MLIRKTGRAARPTVATYRDDPLYPRIERAVARILANGKVVAPVDVLVGMGLLAPEKLEDWRRGRVHYLEAVIKSFAEYERPRHMTAARRVASAEQKAALRALPAAPR